MITRDEKDGILRYVEFLLVKQFLEPVIDKHVTDPDVIGGSYNAIFGVLNELERTLEEYRADHLVDLVPKNT